jgi:succinyl-CoA:acetate CoA-transferase
MNGSADRVDGVETMSAAAAADEIPDDATIGVSGFGSVGYPKAVPLALAESGRDLELTIISGGSVGEEIDTALVEADAISRRFPYQARSESRAGANDGTIAFHDRHISRVSDEVALGQLPTPDVALVEAVAVGEDWLIPSLSIGATPAVVEAADKVIVEVNDEIPTELREVHDVYRPDAPPNREPIPLTEPAGRIGGPEIEFDPEKLAAVVRTSRRGTPYQFREPTDRDEQIAANLAGFLAEEVEENDVFDEELRLQFGVGNIGNALMGALSDLDVGDRDIVYFGEVVQDGLLDMLDDGIVSAASGTSLALSEDGQEQFFENIDTYAESVVVRPADVSNAPEVIARMGVVGVNSALEVDVYGHANSTHVGGTRVVNGIGGSGDFNRNSLLSVTALPSTAKDGEISRIVPMVPHVDHTEHELGIVVTEHGVADLRGLSPRERADELVSECADPSFRDDLRSYLERAEEAGGHVPHDLDRAFSWTDN